MDISDGPAWTHRKNNIDVFKNINYSKICEGGPMWVMLNKQQQTLQSLSCIELLVLKLSKKLTEYMYTEVPKYNLFFKYILLQC